jgi:uncharacterized protein YkwD
VNCVNVWSSQSPYRQRKRAHVLALMTEKISGGYICERTSFISWMYKKTNHDYKPFFWYVYIVIVYNFIWQIYCFVYNVIAFSCCVRMKKTTMWIILLSLVGSLIAWEPVFSQKQDNIKKNVKKELLQTVAWQDTSYHRADTPIKSDSNNIDSDSIINESIDNILKTNENWLEIIWENMTWEINKLRKWECLNELVLDDNLTKAAQAYAEEMNNTKRKSHIWKWGTNPRTRANRAWYKWSYVLENRWKDFYSIHDVIYYPDGIWRKNSKTHYDNMMNKNILKIWVGQCGEYTVVMFWK